MIRAVPLTTGFADQLAREAITAAEPGDIVQFQRGLYRFSAPIDGLPVGITLAGEGPGTVLQYGESVGDLLRPSWDPARNDARDIVIRDMVLRLDSAAINDEGGALAIMGGGDILVQNVRTDGPWGHGIILDGACVVTVERCKLEHARAGSDGVWLTGGDRGFTVGDATNANVLSGVRCNGPETAFRLTGGAANTFRDCFANLRTPQGRFAAFGEVTALRFDGCYSEGQGAAHFESMAKAQALTIQGGSYTGLCPFVHFGATVYNLTLIGAFIAAQQMTGCARLTGPVVALGNRISIPEPCLFDVEPAWTSHLLYNFGETSPLP